MKIIVYLPRGGAQTFENATAIRNPEFPHWVDIIEAEPERPRNETKILAMVPEGSIIVLERTEAEHAAFDAVADGRSDGTRVAP